MNKPQSVRRINIYYFLLFMKKKSFTTTFYLTILLITGLCSSGVSAQQISTTGNLRNYNAVLSSPDYEYLTGRNRLILDLEKNLSAGRIFISGEALNTYTDSLNALRSEINEAYADLYLANTDLRIGRQIISYGRAEGVFITDILSPLDLQEFLTQPVSLIKTGLTALKATRYFNSGYLELVATPVFESDRIAGAGSRWFPFSQVDQSIPVSYADSSFYSTEKRFQASLRYALRSSLNWNLDLFAMYWTDGSPSFKKELIIQGIPPTPVVRLEKTYLQKPILAYSGNYILHDNLILVSESAFHFQKYFDYLPELIQENEISELDINQLLELNNAFAENEDGFLKKKPWLISMAGLQFDAGGYRNTLQLINEHIFYYEDIMLQEENYWYATFSVQKTFLRDKLRASAFSRYNFEGKDFWVNPEVKYELADGMEAGLGFHMFAGKDSPRLYGHFTFSDYAPNSFGYIQFVSYF